MGRGNASADYEYDYGMSRNRFQVPDEDSSGMSTSQCRRVELPSQGWRVCKPGDESRVTTDTDEADEVDGILDCFVGADIFGVL